MEPFGEVVDWSGHLALVHEDERQRRLGVASWARSGLELGAKMLYIEPPFEPAERSFLHLLAEHHVDGDTAVARGQVEVFAADSRSYDTAWQSGIVQKALADGYPTVRWSAEAATAWGVTSPAVHTDVEWATDELCRSMPVSVLCQYAAALPQAALQTACAMHAAGLRQSQLRASPRPDGVALAGAVDTSNHRVARAAVMAASTAYAGRCLVVDLCDLDFLDVGGARAFLTGTTARRLDGGSVCLRGARGTVARVLFLLEVDKADGFRVEAA